MNGSAKSSFDMSRLCQPKCWKMLHIFIWFSSIHWINSTGSLPFGLFMIKRRFATPQLDPEQLLRDALAGHSQCHTVDSVWIWYGWSGQGAKMTGTPLKVPWSQETWYCWYREWPVRFQPPPPWRHESNPHPSHSKSWHLKTLSQLLRFNPFLRYDPLKQDNGVQVPLWSTQPYTRLIFANTSI